MSTKPPSQSADSLSYARLHKHKLYEELPYAEAKKARSAMAQRVRADLEATLEEQVRDPLAGQLERLGLQENLAEVIDQGYTVIRNSGGRQQATEGCFAAVTTASPKDLFIFVVRRS